MSEKILTVDGSATREAIRIKFYNLNRYARDRRINYTTIDKMLTGRQQHVPKYDSVYQAVLRQLQADGVLVESAELQEAA